MKHFFSFLLALLLAMPLFAQDKRHSSLGAVHTPKGRLHLLVIFIRYADKDLQPWSKTWPNSDELPALAQGPNNELFDASPDRVLAGERNPNLTDFYYTMSGGKFLVTADVFPVQVPVKYIPERGASFFGRQNSLNRAAVEWIAANYPDFDWSKYDNRKNNPYFRSDNSQSEPDGVLDYVIFLHRDLGFQTGMAASGRHNIPGTDYSIAHGLTGIKCHAGARHQWEYFKHEFAHNLFGAPHYMGANNTDGNKYYVQKGWGLMSTLSPNFFVANAWERWWLGWFEPQQIEEAGTYLLKDFVTTGDALRIRIPGTRDYLWVENHQKRDLWDDKIFYDEPEKGHPITGKGVYMYVVAEPGADRNQPLLATHNPAHCNLMKVLNAQGNWDFELTGDSVEAYFKPAVYRRDRLNPLAGQNDLQSIRVDKNQDGFLRVGFTHGNRDGGAGEMDDLWAEEVNGKARATLNIMGDEQDAFQPGDEVSLSGIMPALNYPVYDRAGERFEPFRLNGIRIRLIDSLEDGSQRIQVDFDDWEIRQDQRWCGNILLPASQEGRLVELAQNVNLVLDLSGTPDRLTPHPQNGKLANPTRWVVEPGNTLRLKRGSRLILREGSQLQLDSALLVIDARAQLVVEKGSLLSLGKGSELLVKRRGRLRIEEPSGLRQEEGAKVVK
jgi:M6 family metalloprotease-like protein